MVKVNLKTDRLGVGSVLTSKMIVRCWWTLQEASLNMDIREAIIASDCALPKFSAFRCYAFAILLGLTYIMA